MHHLSRYSRLFLVLGTVTFFLFGCDKKKQLQVPVAVSSIKYATGFHISRVGNSQLVEVTMPYAGARKGYRYLLVPAGEEVPVGVEDAVVIYTPLKSIVCTSTTHIPLLDYLGMTDRLTGFPTTDYISSAKMRSRIDSGHVVDLGNGQQLNVERLVTLHPDVVMGYQLGGEAGPLKKLQGTGIPLVINAEYLERHPLGRAEWIKFMGALFHRERAADSVFRIIEKEYLSAVALAFTITDKPKVLSGIVYGDAWFLPGGSSYSARLLEDAGYDYPWKGDSTQGNISMTFESVYVKAKDADFWVGAGSMRTLKELQEADLRYALFQSFKAHRVYTYTAKLGEKGGNEYLELGYLRPDLILKDLIKISHSELMPQYELYFYEQLR